MSFASNVTEGTARAVADLAGGAVNLLTRVEEAVAGESSATADHTPQTIGEGLRQGFDDMAAGLRDGVRTITVLPFVVQEADSATVRAVLVVLVVVAAC